MFRVHKKPLSAALISRKQYVKDGDKCYITLWLGIRHWFRKLHSKENVSLFNGTILGHLPDQKRLSRRFLHGGLGPPRSYPMWFHTSRGKNNRYSYYDILKNCDAKFKTAGADFCSVELLCCMTTPVNTLQDAREYSCWIQMQQRFRTSTVQSRSRPKELLPLPKVEGTFWWGGTEKWWQGQDFKPWVA